MKTETRKDYGVRFAEILDIADRLGKTIDIKVDVGPNSIEVMIRDRNGSVVGDWKEVPTDKKPSVKTLAETISEEMES